MRPLPLFLSLSLSVALSQGLRAAEATASDKPGSSASGANPKVALASISATPTNASFAQNIVRVNVTAQPYDFGRPWSKRAPLARRALGAVLTSGRILVTAECVANANYVELESTDGDSKEPAVVESVDYEANLALLKPESSSFIKGRTGLEFDEPSIGDSLAVLQLEANGQVQSSSGRVTTAEVTRYPIDDASFLVCRLSVPLQMKDGLLSLPVVKGGKLVGLMLRYDSQSSLLDFIPSSVAKHFLKDTEHSPYEGFPRMGAAFSFTRDPQLRRYLGLNGNNGGVLITQVLREGPAEIAGLRKGDVLTEIDGKAIDSDGNYIDEAYGRISLGHLISTKHFEGEKVKVRFLRDGKVQDAEVPVARRKPSQYLSEPYVIDRAPHYYVLGGLVLQELSRQYLKEFGADWARKAPLELVHLDRTQSEIQNDVRKRAVVLTRVLPSDVTVGYEDLRNLLVTSINGVSLNSLEDVPKALEKAANGLHRIELKGDPSLIFLDAKAVLEAGPGLQRAYGLPALSRIP